ncbi:hypothetical protein [Nonomuraea sp. NPDC050310]|uniref:hypothetical protein n=1 Tax=Nonomuraea sp. NPDC050310 TaxID=3154935 RepID=UPI0033DC4ECA
MSASVRQTSNGTGVGGTITVPRPPGTLDTDSLWALQVGGDHSEMTAAGWTSVVDVTDEITGALKARLWQRIAGSAASYAFGHSGLGRVLIAAVPGVTPGVAARVAIYAAGIGEDGHATTPSVTPAASTHLELRWIAASYNEGGSYETTATWQAPTGYQLHTSGSGSASAPGSPATILASKLITSSSPSGPKDFITDAGAITVGITLSLPSGALEPETPPIPADAPGRGDALYTYEFRRLDGSFLGTLKGLRVDSFERKLNRRGQINAGTFSASFPISNEDDGDLVAQLIARDASDLTLGPGTIVCDVWRAGDHWGRYWIIGSKITKQRRSHPELTLSGMTFDGYPDLVALEHTLGPYTGMDRAEIARQALTHMATQPDADLGLILASGSSGSTLTRTYEPFQGSYGRPLQDVTEGVDGIEWTLDTVLGTGGVELHWRWGAPLGNPDAGHEFNDSPNGGNLLDYSIEQTPLQRGTRWRARGDSVSTDASTTATPLLSDPYSSPHLATGRWLRMDRTVDRPGVVDKNILDGVAEQLAATAGGAPQILSITVLLGEQPTIKPNLVGDVCRIVITDEWFKRINGGAGLDTRRRILGMRTIPVSRDHGRDEAEIFLDPQEVI